MSLRLGAEPQCAFVDRHLDGLTRAVQDAQHRALIAGSRGGSPRGGLMAAQVPRGVRFGMAVGRYPTTALRDVLIAVTSVVVDDQILAPLLRMGRRAHTTKVAPELPHEGHGSHRAHHPKRANKPVGKIYEDALVLMWSTGQAVMAAPLNALVLGSTLIGAAVGLCAGAVMAIGVGLLAPRKLLRHLCPSLAVLTHLTNTFEVVELAQRARKRALQHPDDSALQARTRTVWRDVQSRVLANDEAILALCLDGSGLDLAQELETELLAMPRTRRFLGLGSYPPNNVERLMAARQAFDDEDVEDVEDF